MAMPLHDPVIQALHVSNDRPALKAIHIPFTAAVSAFIARRDTFSGRRSQISPSDNSRIAGRCAAMLSALFTATAASVHGSGGLRRLFALLIDTYQRFAPERLRSACRFEPTCSNYARLAVDKHGLGRGLSLAMRRLWRCRPPNGGIDYP